ncbi:MAG: thioredoxin domain-containing protein [Acetobacteraceae bacterium]|nr:thioredoxin domain-containing protein [Acetobacteraceae bacterium]
MTAGAFALPRSARADDPTQAERSIGSADAKIVVGEYFSLTCTHCAAFAKETMPQIKSQLIDTGKVRWVFHDFPLDQVALTAALVARHLPVDRYEPFVNALFGTQDRWAFARGVNSTDELWKMAALAGMSRTSFDAAVGDATLRSWILQQQQADQDKWKVDSTPSFVINNQKYAGEMNFDAFNKLLPAS